MKLKDIEKILGDSLTVIEADALVKELNEYRESKRKTVISEIPEDELNELRELVNYIAKLEDRTITIPQECIIDLYATVFYENGKIHLDYYYSDELMNSLRKTIDKEKVIALSLDVAAFLQESKEKLQQLYDGVKLLSNKYGIPYGPIWKLIDPDNIII